LAGNVNLKSCEHRHSAAASETTGMAVNRGRALNHLWQE
jgi:hypothetical protein